MLMDNGFCKLINFDIYIITKLMNKYINIAI